MTRLDDKREPRSKEGNNGEGQEVERESIKSRTNNISPEAGTERERERGYVLRCNMVGRGRMMNDRDSPR